jgi:hypothetical protein
MVRLSALAAVLLVAHAAAADDDEPPATFHKGQLGVSARLALGLRGIATYNDTDYCGKTDTSTSTGNAPVCTGRTPLALDLEAAFGVSRKIELLVEMRLGLERDFGATANQSGPRPFHLAPGARFFFAEASHSKLFVQPMAVFDFSGYKDNAGKSLGTDYGVRALEGYWLDVHRTYGMYAFAGETLEFSRWLEASFEAGVGIQGRYP